MCCPMRETCIRCSYGERFSNADIRQVETRVARGQRPWMSSRYQDLYPDRKCCSGCPEPAQDDRYASKYEEKAAAYEAGTLGHNPCDCCGQYDRCAEQLRRGYLT